MRRREAAWLPRAVLAAQTALDAVFYRLVGTLVVLILFTVLFGHLHALRAERAIFGPDLCEADLPVTPSPATRLSVKGPPASGCIGGAVRDACGVCNGGGLDIGCDGVCFSGLVVDCAGVCGGTDKSCLIDP